MTRRVRGYLELIRPANVCTSVADVTAGFLYMGGRASDWPALALLGGASALLYAGGVALNDVCDAPRDALERPERPIPSGRVRRGAALAVSLALLVSGVFLASMFSWDAAVVAGALLLTIVLYNALFKRTVAGPAMMGLCRAMNLGLGMTVFPEYRMTLTLIPVLCLMWLYVASVTFFARNEAGVSSGRRLTWGTVGVVAAVLGLGGLSVIVPGAHRTFLLLVVVLAAALGFCGLRASASREPVSVQRTAGTFVVSLVLFDTCIGWAAQGPGPALAVACWLIPARLLSRVFRVT